MDKMEGETMVEAGGFEPPTPCLQSRCNDENTGSMNPTDRTETHDGAQLKDAEETQGKERPWTPGPWSLWRGPEYVGGGEDICIGAGKEWLANMDHRRPICKDVVSLGHRDDECDICTIDSGEISREQLANARLIASAPELFEALAELLEAVEGHCHAGFWTDEIAQARAALNKALGEDRG